MASNRLTREQVEDLTHHRQLDMNCRIKCAIVTTGQAAPLKCHFFMVRCVLEGYTYWKVLDKAKLIKDYDKGVRIVDLHTSGHADAETIQALIDDVAPTYILPVHTENTAWFEQHQNCSIIHDKVFSL